MSTTEADALAVVEAAYRLDGTELEWVRGFLEPARALVDEGLGASAWLYELRGPVVVVRSLAWLGVSEPMARALIAASDEVPAEAYRVGVAVTLSEVLGGTRAIPSDRKLVDELGCRDNVRASITDPSGHGVALGAPLPRLRTLTRGERLRLSRVAAHLHTALRARMRRESESASDDAVLRPDGRVEHAEHGARDRSAREALREAARTIDRARGRMRRTDPDGALESWRALVDGTWTLLDRFESDGRRFLVARRNEPRAARPGGLTPAESRCAIYVAMGHSQEAGRLRARHLDLHGLDPRAARDAQARGDHRGGARPRVREPGSRGLTPGHGGRPRQSRGARSRAAARSRSHVVRASLSSCAG